MEPTTQDQSVATPGTKKHSFWYHLHFWIGWISAIPLALVCLTGALLVFSASITQWENKELFQLETAGPRLSIAEVLKTYETANPRYRVSHLMVPESPNHAYKAYAVQIHPDGNRNMQVYLNPYTGELTSMAGKFSLVNVITGIHRNLIGTKTGELIVAISSALLAITCILGVILWVPLRARTFARAWKRGQALDWHNAIGVIILVPLIVMAVTGVTFTWGKQLFPMLDKLQSVPSRLEVPVVTPPVGGAAKIPFPTVADSIGTMLPGVRITGIQPSNSKTSPHVFIMDEDGNNLRVFMDPYTGKEIMRMDGSGTGLVGWYRSNFGKIHTFAPYGTFWRVVWGVLSLGGTVLVVTGVWVSIKRWRREKRTAA